MTLWLCRADTKAETIVAPTKPLAPVTRVTGCRATFPSSSGVCVGFTGRNMLNRTLSCCTVDIGGVKPTEGSSREGGRLKREVGGVDIYTQLHPTYMSQTRRNKGLSLGSHMQCTLQASGLQRWVGLESVPSMMFVASRTVLLTLLLVAHAIPELVENERKGQMTNTIRLVSQVVQGGMIGSVRLFDVLVGQGLVSGVFLCPPGIREKNTADAPRIHSSISNKERRPSGSINPAK